MELASASFLGRGDSAASSFLKVRPKGQPRNRVVTTPLKYPEHDLLYAIFVRAWEDLFCPSRVARESARRWFISEESSPMSFEGVCEELELSWDLKVFCRRVARLSR